MRNLLLSFSMSIETLINLVTLLQVPSKTISQSASLLVLTLVSNAICMQPIRSVATNRDVDKKAKKVGRPRGPGKKPKMPKRPRLRVDPVWDKAGRPWTTIGIPSPPNPALYTKSTNFGHGLKPQGDPECRLKDPTECCDDIWHPHWWAVYVSLQETWPWYLEQEAWNPGKWNNVPQELPILTYTEFKVPMKAIDVEIHPRNSLGPWSDRIIFACIITLDENDVLYDRAVALRQTMRLKITRFYQLHCQWNEMAVAEAHKFQSPQSWMEGRTSPIQIPSDLRYYCKPRPEQEPTAQKKDKSQRRRRRARSQSAAQIEGPHLKSCVTLDKDAIQTGSIISAYVAAEPILEEGDFDAVFDRESLQSHSELDPAYKEVYDQVIGQLIGSNTMHPEANQQPAEMKTQAEIELERLEQADQYTQLIDTQWMDEAIELFGISSASLSTTIPAAAVAEHPDVRLPHSFTAAEVGPAQFLQHIVTSTEWEVIRANPDSKVQSCAYTNDDEREYLWPGSASQFRTAIFDPPFLLDG